MSLSARFALEKQLVFAATGASFLSAYLLFSVQPMFTKMVLPVLGGSAATWSVAMVFFQAVLLLGYAYAHFLTRHLSFKRGAIIHLGLLLVAFATLPITFNAGTAPQMDQHPALWILTTFALALGLPFLALSTHGPLLQAWFAQSPHPRAQNPYFLYVASNIGSFAALLAYPFLIEPFMGLTLQSKIWSVGFATLTLLITATLFCIKPRPDQQAKTNSQAEPLRATTALSWIGLTFIPSALLISVTSHISTDVAAAPLLWVAPLALFLLSFPVAFRESLPIIKETELHVLMIWGITALLINIIISTLTLPISLVAHLSVFFVVAVACHHALYKMRPSPQMLTSFYLCMSSGGVLGGLFCGLIAPSLFNEVTEYPLLLIAALSCLPGALKGIRHLDFRRDLLRPLCCLAAALLVALAISRLADQRKLGEVLLCASAGILVLLKWRHYAYVMVAMAAGFIVMSVHDLITLPRESYRSFFGVTHIVERTGGDYRVMVHGATVHGAIRITMGGLVLMRWRTSAYALAVVTLSFVSITTYKTLMADDESYRSFFGVTQVKQILDDQFRVMVHGTTIHGAMRIHNEDGTAFTKRPLPTTYYSYEGPLGEALAHQREKHGTLKHTALIGLGTGALACHFKEGESATFYELDPLVAKLAQDPKKFRFLSDCGIKIPVILGDARLTLAQQKNKSDVVLIDAFSSDSIPVHLLTLEAIDLYLDKLAAKGRIVLHISNNYFDLQDVLARAAAKRGLHGIVKIPTSKNIDSELRSSSSVAVLARSSVDLDGLRDKTGWLPLPAPQRPHPWTDDYSTILEPLIDMWRRKGD